MALQRKIDWSSAMRDIRNDRCTKPAAGYLASRSIEQARLDRLAREAAAVPFVAGASFDRSAIMKAAVASARAHRAKGSKASWSALMAAALKSVWFHAKQQRAFTAH